MFESLSEKLQSAFGRLRGRGRISERQVKEALRELRMAMLEADVNYKVTREFIDKVQARAMQEETLKSVTPHQQTLAIVSEELTALMGEKAEKLIDPGGGPMKILMTGLNGAGKTTASAKLALRLQKEGRAPLMAACDVYRPAAVEQLQTLGGQIDAPVFALEGADPAKIARESLRFAEKNGRDTVIIDTAGRMQTNEELMDELEAVQNAVQPTETLLVVDATLGQEAVSVAETFHQRLGLTGVVLSKIDGDARGGAAISIRSVTGTPIKFFSSGERLDALEEFHPERIASRILGQGDMLTLIEKAEAAMDEEKAKEMEERILAQKGLTFNDFLDQLSNIQKMGSLEQVLGMIPGFDRMKNQGFQPDEKQLKQVEAIVLSMTPAERGDHRLLDASRKRRIAKGSGTSVQQINQLVKQLSQMNSMMRQMTGGAAKSSNKRRVKQRVIRNNFPFN